MSRNRFLDRCGWYEPRHSPLPSTTRQAEVLNLALASSPTTHRGLIVGVDRLSGQVVCHDPLTAWHDGLVSTPQVAVVGDPGKGADVLVKTWGVLRQLIFARRRVVVLDTTGDYADVARALGAPSVDFAAGSRLNLLDPAIPLGVHRGDEDGSRADPAGKPALLRAVLAMALGREIDEREGRALRIALTAAVSGAEERGRVPVLADLVHHLINPATDAHVPAAELREWGLDQAFALERLAEECLAGALDAPTTPDLRLDHPTGLTRFDLSGLPSAGRARQVLAVLLTTWQANLLARRAEDGDQVVTVLDDGRLAAGSLAQHGFSGADHAVLTVFQHPATLPETALSSLRAARTVFLFGQSRHDDAVACAELYGLPPGSAQTIMSLEKGSCLVKIGDGAPLPVRHVLTPGEERLISRAAGFPVRR